MFEFVEAPFIQNKEFPMLEKRCSSVVVQNGIQPVCFTQENIEAGERPVALQSCLFRFGRRKEKKQ